MTLSACKPQTLRLCVPLFVILAALTAHAGGPIAVGSPKLGVDGQPFVWDNSAPIRYTTDGGTLGSLSNSSANQLVAQMFQQWAVPTAALSFQRVGPISGVADGDVSTLGELDSVMQSCDAGSQSPIIYDGDGSLLKEATGDDSVLGFAGPCDLSSTGKIASAFAVLANPSNLTANLLQAEVLHELGHFLGLDHTDVRQPFAGGTTAADANALPTMYWELINENQNTLSVDDVAWISRLYPSPAYSATYGTITGQVFFSDGKTPVQDVLVIARSVSDPHITTVASISGYLFTGNPGQSLTTNYLPCTDPTQCTHGTLGDNSDGDILGSRNRALLGTFDIPVPAGQYTVEVRSPSGSGKIGPINPTLIVPGPEEYWDTDETDHDVTQPSTVGTTSFVTVNAGQTISNINIILNGTDPTFDIFDGGIPVPGQIPSSAPTAIPPAALPPTRGTGGRP